MTLEFKERNMLKPNERQYLLWATYPDYYLDEDIMHEIQ
jgi:hypothetical protein